eukprot:scaffold156973_cov31-Tisochrysis_lutea.AAC.1
MFGLSVALAFTRFGDSSVSGVIFMFELGLSLALAFTRVARCSLAEAGVPAGEPAMNLVLGPPGDDFITSIWY